MVNAVVMGSSSLVGGFVRRRERRCMEEARQSIERFRGRRRATPGKDRGGEERGAPTSTQYLAWLAQPIAWVGEGAPVVSDIASRFDDEGSRFVDGASGFV